MAPAAAQQEAAPTVAAQPQIIEREVLKVVEVEKPVVVTNTVTNTTTTTETAAATAAATATATAAAAVAEIKKKTDDIEAQIKVAKDACDKIDTGKMQEIVNSLQSSKDASIASTVGSGLGLAAGATSLIVNKGQGAGTNHGTFNIVANSVAAAGAVTTAVASTVATVQNISVLTKIDDLVGQVKACHDAFPSSMLVSTTTATTTEESAYNTAVSNFAEAKKACDSVDTGALDKIKSTAGGTTALSAAGALSGIASGVNATGLVKGKAFGGAGAVAAQGTEGEEGYVAGSGKTNAGGFKGVFKGDSNIASSTVGLIGSGVGTVTSAIAIGTSNDALGKAKDVKRAMDDCKSKLSTALAGTGGAVKLGVMTAITTTN
jgi:hypothetical protein